MMKFLRSRSMRLMAGLVVLSCAVPPPARADVTTNIKENFDGFTVFVPCANGGLGEDVVFTGDLHVLMTFTIDSGGGVHAKYHFQPQGLQGVGLVTGAQYNATGVTQDEYNSTVGYEETFVNNFRIIGQGPGNNYLVHEVFHITINANGDVTSSFDNPSVDCK